MFIICFVKRNNLLPQMPESTAQSKYCQIVKQNINLTFHDKNISVSFKGSFGEPEILIICIPNSFI